MPFGAIRPDFRSRAGVAAVVIVGHVSVLALLMAARERDADSAADERMTLVFVEPLADVTMAGQPGRPARTTRPAVLPQAVVTEARAPGAADPAPGIDWYADGSNAAGRAVAPTTTA